MNMDSSMNSHRHHHCEQQRMPAAVAETPRSSSRRRKRSEEDSYTGDSMRPQARRRRVRLVEQFHSISLVDGDVMTPSRQGFFENDNMLYDGTDNDVLTETSTLGADEEEEDDDDVLFLSDKEIAQKEVERKVLFELVFPEHYKNPLDRKIDQIILENSSPVAVRTKNHVDGVESLDVEEMSLEE